MIDHRNQKMTTDVFANVEDNSRIRRAFDEAYNQAMINLSLPKEGDPNSRPFRFIHGASILSGSKVIGSGYNSYNRNYIQGRFYLSLHAELAAILNASLPAKQTGRPRGSWMWCPPTKREHQQQYKA